MDIKTFQYAWRCTVCHKKFVNLKKLVAHQKADPIVHRKIVFDEVSTKRRP
jgi:hypothetical protein